MVIADSRLNGLPRAELVHPNAIILDLSIRNMNSFRLIEKRINDPQTQAIPIVLLTTKARWLDLQVLQQYQIVGVVLKAFEPVTLHFQIAAILD